MGVERELLNVRSRNLCALTACDTSIKARSVAIVCVYPQTVEPSPIICLAQVLGTQQSYSEKKIWKDTRRRWGRHKLGGRKEDNQGRERKQEGTKGRNEENSKAMLRPI